MKERRTHRALAVLLCTGVLGAQTENWTLLTTASAPAPELRIHTPLAYSWQTTDSLLFGGRVDNPFPELREDTWIFDGVTWTQLAPANHPDQRHGHGLIYDSTRDVHVLFGGGPFGSPWDDTWEFDGTDWQEVAVTNRPPARMFHSMVFDDFRGKAIVFGGSIGLQQMNDTWQFDGSDWSQIATQNAPSPRSNAAMAFSLSTCHMLLFGGLQDPGPGQQDLNDTWLFDGSDWQQLQPTTQPPAGHDRALVYEAHTNTFLLTGGNVAGDGMDSWRFDGTDWTQVTTATRPGRRVGHAAVYDLSTNRTVIYGGRWPAATWYDDTWTLANGTLAASIAFGQGCGSPPMALLQDEAYRPVLGQQARLRIADAPTPWIGITVGFDNQSTGGNALPSDLTALGMPGCALLHSAELTGLAATATANGTEFRLQLPPENTLLGADVFVQAYALAPGANAAGVVTSDARHWTLGDV